MTKKTGFTLIEILIATSILTLGLVGILALFPVAIEEGRKVAEASNSVVIAQSVVNAIRSGLRNSKGFTRKNDPEPYFLLRHDGVRDTVPADPRKIKPGSDYFILLPRFRNNESFSGATEKARRVKALKKAKTRVLAYPGAKTLQARDAWIEKVYRLGRKLIPNPGRNDRLKSAFVDFEKKGAVSAAFLKDHRVLRDLTIETLRQYSFAIKVRNSFFDADDSTDASFKPTNKLYHFTVLIYRGFPDDPDKPGGPKVKEVLEELAKVNRKLRIKPEDRDLLKERARLETIISPVEEFYFEVAI